MINLKKAVMFDKLSRLDHCDCCCAKSAAMFGLDARIALTIFGALSVITGAAIYGVLKKVHSVKTIYEMKEVMKAYEAYWLDTQETPKQVANETVGWSNWRFYFVNLNDLIKNPGVKGWKGPYLQGYYINEAYPLEDRKTGLSKIDNEYDVQMFYGNISTDWGSHDSSGNPGNSFQGYCESGEECALWISSAPNLNKSVIEKMDKEYDGGDGPASGNVKWCMNNAETYYYYFLKFLPVKNPND